ncbi:MAG: hypothetical protein AB7I96_10565 [Candidatus Dadabacteria bacterium]
MIFQWTVIDDDGFIVGDFYSSSQKGAFERFEPPPGTRKIKLLFDEAEACANSWDTENGIYMKRIREAPAGKISIEHLSQEDVAKCLAKKSEWFRDTLQSDGSIKRE